MTAQGEGRINEPYDPIPDIIDRAERRPDGIAELKQIARMAFQWHQPEMGWFTDGTKDPKTGEERWHVDTKCSCGSGNFPCRQRKTLTAVFGVEEVQR
ncbi:hypothetical protein [Streptomyces hygroscopicus]|uniref:hypothetical protein n=1 Tax=Streptomyces hygroscopicus TaxID=1912 RepID=UPI0033F562D1